MAPEFSHLFDITGLDESNENVSLSAQPEERQALARRFGVLSLDSLTAELELMPETLGLRVTGRVRAKGAQSCRVSLEPIPFELDEPVDVLFSPDGEAGGEGHLLEETQDIEPLTGNEIDLGELVAQIFGLGLDPYPRKAELPTLAQAEENERRSPFAILAEWGSRNQ